MKISGQIKKYLEKLKNIRLLVFLGFAGMILILFSELFSSDKSDKPVKETRSEEITDFSASTESKLEKILSRIDGVGKVSVLVSVEGTEEYVFAQEIKESNSDGTSSSQSENNFVIVQKDGDKEALIRKTINPQITGVVVVCDGGADSIVKEKVYKAVAVALDLTSDKIYVTKNKI